MSVEAQNILGRKLKKSSRLQRKGKVLSAGFSPLESVQRGEREP